jgi:hypothetical protein
VGRDLWSWSLSLIDMEDIREWSCSALSGCDPTCRSDEGRCHGLWWMIGYRLSMSREFVREVENRLGGRCHGSEIRFENVCGLPLLMGKLCMRGDHHIRM